MSRGDFQLEMGLTLYSSWKLNDLQNEWIINYSFLPDLFVLLADSSSMFTRPAFEKRLALIRDDFANRYPHLGHAMAPDALLSIFYAIGLVGVVRQGQTKYYYQDKLEGRLHPEDDQFAIHPSFRPALHSNSAFDLRQFEPDVDTVIGRYLRGLRLGISHEEVRGTQVFQMLKLLDDRLRRIGSGKELFEIPDEVQTEIRANTEAMRQEVTAALDLDRLEDGRERATRVVERVFKHLTEMSMRVRESGIVSEKSDALYVLEDLQRRLERFVLFGALGDGAQS